MSFQPTLTDSLNTISSPGSEAGRWPLNSPDGRRMRQYVREVRRASLLVWLENEAGGTTPVTWLRPFSTSSQSCDLQLFLANRLAQQLKNCGSMLYSLSWKTKATPAGRQYCQRAASAPRTKEIAGLSPLARGTQLTPGNSAASDRFIPAGAGNTDVCDTIIFRGAVYPRWRGEHCSSVSMRG